MDMHVCKQQQHKLTTVFSKCIFKCCVILYTPADIEYPAPRRVLDGRRRVPDPLPDHADPFSKQTKYSITCHSGSDADPVGSFRPPGSGTVSMMQIRIRVAKNHHGNLTYKWQKSLEYHIFENRNYTFVYRI